ncbi:MAG: DUF3990 domain-containing protein, partial [Bacteroidales bacterium]|nr:DUF3990 domain-containing protein [Bacteroidales bacterium]
MMTLFHGSYVQVPLPLAKAGRKKLDFGPGFYMTNIETQAQSWAIVVAGRKGRTITPVVSKYSFDRESALN